MLSVRSRSIPSDTAGYTVEMLAPDSSAEVSERADTANDTRLLMRDSARANRTFVFDDASHRTFFTAAVSARLSLARMVVPRLSL